MKTHLFREIIIFAWITISCATVHAQRFVKVVDNIAALVAANPFDVHTNVFVTGRVSANDGGGGIYTWNSASTAATNSDLSILKANSISVGRWFLQPNNNVLSPDCVYVEGPDIDDTGLTDSTTGFNRVIAKAVSLGFGRICIPPGKYGVNLMITNDNVVIVGCGNRDVNLNSSIALFPWDTSKFTIQVGNDIGIVNGFGLRDVAVLGHRNLTNALGALYFAGGAYHGDVSFAQFIGGADTVKFKTGTTFPCTLNALSHCAIWEGTNSTVVVDDTRTGSGYCTGNKISDSSINGFNTGGQAIRVIKGRLNLEGVYLDGNDNFSILSKDGGMVSCVNCDLENSSGQSAVLLTVDWTGQTYSERDVSRFINGGARIQGMVQWIDDTGTNYTQIPINGGLEWPLDRASLRQPWIALPMKIGTTLNPYDGIFQFDMAGTNGPFWFKRSDGDILRWSDRTSESIKDVDGGDVNTFLEFEFKGLSTADANVRFFRDTTTSGNKYLQIFKGDGSADTQTLLNAFGDSYINALTGNLGIGTASPTEKLDVDGTATVSTSVIVGSGSGRAGVIEMSSTNGTHTLALSLLPNGSLTFTNDGVLIDTLALSSLYSGGGTKFKSDDGTYKEVTYPPGAIATNININPTDGFLPYRSNSTAFGDSPLAVGTNAIYAKFGSTSSFLVNSNSGFSGVGTKDFSDDGTFKIRTNYVTIALGNPNVALTTGNTNFWVASEAVTIKTVTAHLLVPSSSGSVTLELKKNGTTVLSSPVSIASGATNATATVSVTSVSGFDRLAGEVTAAGTTAYGPQLKIGFTTP